MLIKLFPTAVLGAMAGYWVTECYVIVCDAYNVISDCSVGRYAWLVGRRMWRQTTDRFSLPCSPPSPRQRLRSDTRIAEGHFSIPITHPRLSRLSVCRLGRTLSYPFPRESISVVDLISLIYSLTDFKLLNITGGESIYVPINWQYSDTHS